MRHDSWLVLLRYIQGKGSCIPVKDIIADAGLHRYVLGSKNFEFNIALDGYVYTKEYKRKKAAET